jgi:hypothetical protein
MQILPPSDPHVVNRLSNFGVLVPCYHFEEHHEFMAKEILTSLLS